MSSSTTTISQLPVASSVSDDDLIPVVQGGTTKRATVGQVQAGVLADQQFVTVDSEAGLPQSRQLAATGGLQLTDNGAGSTLSLSTVGVLNSISGLSFAVGDLLVASGTSSVSKIPDVALGQILKSGGVGAAPSYGTFSATGDATGTYGASGLPLTLATVNSNVGSFGDSTHVTAVTVNGKGLVTAASSVAIAYPVTSVFGQIGAIPNLSGDASTSGSSVTTLATVNSNVGSFGDSTHVTAVTVNGKGLVTAASSVAIAYPGGMTGFANPSASIGLTAVNGAATTAMRSDAAPALDQTIAPTWTAQHTFSSLSGQKFGNAPLTLAPGDKTAGPGGNSFNGGIFTQTVTGNYQVCSYQVAPTQSGSLPEWGPVTEFVCQRTVDQSTNFQRISFTAMSDWAGPALSDAATDYRLQQEAGGTKSLIPIKFTSQYNTSGLYYEYLTLNTDGTVQMFRRTDSPGSVGSSLGLILNQEKRGTSNVLTSAGTQNSPYLQQTGNAYDASLHTTDWKWLVSMTSNAGASTYKLQSRIDASAFADKFTVADDGSVSATTSVSAKGGDPSFSAGGNRSVMDVGGGYARVGAVKGGGADLPLKLLSNSVDALVFDSSAAPIATFPGPLDLSTSTSGQVKFPATQNASSNANTIDDYQEKFSTAVQLNFGGAHTGMTTSVSEAEVVKMGRVVFVNIAIRLTAKGSSTGAATITGLPYSAVNITDVSAQLLLTANNMAAAATGQLQGSISAGASSIALQQFAAGAVTSWDDTYFNNNSVIRLMGVFFTDS